MATAVRRRPLTRPWPAAPRRARGPAGRSEKSELLPAALWGEIGHYLIPADGGVAGAEEARRAARGVLWILRRGVPWGELPASVAPAALARRHWQAWMEDGRWLDFWGAFVARLTGESWLGWSRALVRAGEELRHSGTRGREAAARYAWWVVSARLLLWEARWVPGGREGVRRAG